MMITRSREIILDLAPTQPNVNGFYYDEESYMKAMNKFKMQLTPIVKFGYDNNEIPLYAPIVGYVSKLDLDSNKATIVYTAEIDLMQDNFCKLGFTLRGEKIKDIEPPTYRIDKVECANIIIWQL